MNRLYVQLGKAGDIINLLPLLWADAQAGEKSGIMVSERYASILDGCGYLEPVIFKGEPAELGRAVAEAKQLAKTVHCCQVNGPPDVVRELSYRSIGQEYATTESFLKESWLLAGRLGDWRLQHPLVFDKRDKDREAALAAALVVPRKPLLLISDGGESSPFRYKNLLQELVRLKFGKSRTIVNLAGVHAERIYDLLGLYDLASCLIVTDSAPLQLAYGSKVPVVALVNDQPILWNGSVWRPNHVCHIRYGDFPGRAVEMLERIEEVGKVGCWGSLAPEGKPAIVHAWSKYEVNEHNERRNYLALQSWQDAYRESPLWVSTPIDIGALGQDTQHSVLADSVRLPFVVDVIRLACLRAKKDDDLICLTRCHTIFPQGVTRQLLGAPKPLFAYRRYTEPVEHHPAVDLFCFTKAWWREHQAEYPARMVMGLDPYWHQALASLIVKYGGRELPNVIWRHRPEEVKSSGIPKYVAHNQGLVKQQTLIPPLIPAVHTQAESVIVNRHAIRPFGYNPSIIRHKGRLLMAYRWHSGVSASTVLAMAELDDKLNVVSNRDIRADANGYGSAEDPRLFEHKGQLWMSYVVSTYPEVPSKAAVRYGRLAEGSYWSLEETAQPKHGANNGAGMEKNWLIFEREDAGLVCIYSRSPYVLFRLIGDEPHEVNTWPAVTWPWGQIKGGTAPVPYDNGWLTFFHSRMDNEPAPYRWRYYVGAMWLSPDLSKVMVSKAPLLRGSEEDSLTPEELRVCSHRKPNVVFPAGCVAVEGGWLVSVGINDCACGLVEFSTTDLQFSKHT